MKNPVNASFRDPSGFVFIGNDEVYRTINLIYQENYDCLIRSGLYSRLVKDKLLVPHQEMDSKSEAGVYKIIKPKTIKYITYPYEWSFNQLKDVGLLALKIQKIALDYGMSLKDGSAYNFQFLDLSPIMIDTLSFEKISDGKPWIAYKQFCQHFLAPLALGYYCDYRLSHLLKHYIDGIPLDLASKLLPLKTYFKLPLLINLHLHARSQIVFSRKQQLRKINRLSKVKISSNSIKALVENLEAAIKGLAQENKDSFWKGYYQDNSYSKAGFKNKQKIVKKFLNSCRGEKTVLDLGCNLGIFSVLSAALGFKTIALDYDQACIDRIYLNAKNNGVCDIVPMVNDLANPSPGLGWNHQERDPLIGRFNVNTVLALALIHHLVIGNNVPLNKSVNFLASMTRKYLIIEFVPMDDPQVKEMTMLRQDWHQYSQADFVSEFSEKFSILKSEKVASNSGRVIYLMQKH